MNNDLDNLKFSTKSIMISDKQREFIESLIDQLNDFDDYTYNKIEYWKLSRQDATKLIKELKSKISDYIYDIGYDPSWDYYD